MSTEIANIKKINGLIKDTDCSGCEIVDTRVSKLTAPGENYGSIMLKVDIHLKDPENGREKVIYGVAKLIPGHEKVREIFNIQVTFKNELAFYSTIIPTLEEFLEQNGLRSAINCFPKLIGGRINLNGSDVVDCDAVILLENLKASGRLL